MFVQQDVLQQLKQEVFLQRPSEEFLLVIMSFFMIHVNKHHVSDEFTVSIS